MSQERPKGSPLHAKRVYAYIGQTNGGALNFVSFATEFNLNLTPQNTARTVVFGSDAVPDVETHGLVARARLNLYLTSSDSDFLLALGGVVSDQNIGTQEVDYDKGVRDLIKSEAFVTSKRVDIMIAPLENSPDFSIGQSIKLDDFRAKSGYIVELNSAAITSLEITGRVGEYTEARLEVESGRFRINAVEDAVI